MTHTAGEHPHPTIGPLDAAAFLLELAMLTILALAGAAVSEATPARMAAAVALPVIAAGIWAVWMAPTATRRLSNPRRLAVQVLLFAVTGVLASAFLSPWVGGVFFVAATAVFGTLARRESHVSRAGAVRRRSPAPR
ncbi:YrdB family protein [Rhodococcus sp. NPDC003322]